jgi:hypothetical protein
MATDNTSEFREQYRKAEISPYYSGRLHFWFTSLWCLALIISCVLFIHQPTWKEWLIVPIGFLYINFAEYIGHKGPMHHRGKRLEKVFIRHTLQHHRFFTYEHFSFDTDKDVKAVLFPPVLLVFFFFAFTVPVALLFYFLWSANAALLFTVTIFAYYLNYEWLHFAYHLPDTHFIARLPLIRKLRKAHNIHHDTHLMTKYNFNITYPICDIIFGTYYTGQ